MFERKSNEEFKVLINGEVNLNWETAPTKLFKPFKVLTLYITLLLNERRHLPMMRK